MEEEADDKNSTSNQLAKEEDNLSALGITMMERETLELEENQNDGEHVVVPDPHADKVDLSELRGTRAPDKGREQMCKYNVNLQKIMYLIPTHLRNI